MRLQELTRPWAAFNYGFLDESAKRELRRRILKAIAVPGYQVPYASREVPMARGWGTGGLQVTLTLLKPTAVVKVIDQGADDSVNACSIRKFFGRVGGVIETQDTQEATIIQSRHRIPEEKLRDDQVLVLQVPDPEPLRTVQSDMSVAREMHGDADYGQLWLVLYEQLVKSGRIMQYTEYPSLVNGRHVISPSPIPRWDVLKLNEADHLTILSAGREKRIYAVPPHTRVEPLVFDDVPYRVEDHQDKTCYRTNVTGFFMNELPQDDGSAKFELSDSHFGVKHMRKSQGETIEIGDTWYKNGKMDQ
ncbi:MAG: carbon-phosphorus lyase complex subunit PhnJ [Mesorhizobium sp.]|uniref:alpha-D-ribose 1-methylphosphonate 5-phosphate C-P-lyase PhnJ n=1 Tax=Mesorhizobium sp. TaxID=1871066 RepID=UPI000FE4FC96|nr:alpha-D-ribose 1-methylphosphonate 5-phosphate C-P-lyase PhnJ [Mesorhizobium sp.]RWK47780.1 MAG: carbon-phosphorus lyase complex subunit PhnJ [Mesorhizobium sp.]